MIDFIKTLIYRFKIKFVYKKHLIKTHLPKNEWYDLDYRLLYGNMNLLVEFVEQEKPFERICWDERQEIKDQIVEIYTWWKEGRKKQLKELDDIYAEIRPEEGWVGNMNNKMKEHEGTFKRITKKDVEIEEAETKYLKMLIDIRGYLWT